MLDSRFAEALPATGAGSSVKLNRVIDFPRLFAGPG